MKKSLIVLALSLSLFTVSFSANALTEKECRQGKRIRDVVFYGMHIIESQIQDVDLELDNSFDALDNTKKGTPEFIALANEHNENVDRRISLVDDFDKANRRAEMIYRKLVRLCSDYYTF